MATIRQPLAAELRPTKLDQIVGQQHLVGPDAPIRGMAERNNMKSSILWGPPGTGKTSIARALAGQTDSAFVALNATSDGVQAVRKVLKEAEIALIGNKTTMVFIDEIHRFSKSQQDILLPGVENGLVILFGTTTETPKHAVNSTLMSRCLVWETTPLTVSDMIAFIDKVRHHYGKRGTKFAISKEAAKLLINRASGDARKLIMVLEHIVENKLHADTQITVAHVEETIPDKHIVFDKTGNEHFDLAHAYQEAIQHSEGDDAIYWLAKWIQSGEDPAYIARRMLITAFEDCGGNPLAPLLAHAACYAVEHIGLPECQIPMAYATVEMAKSKRNKVPYRAIQAAMADVTQQVLVMIPPELRAGTNGYTRQIERQYIRGWRRDVAAFEQAPDTDEGL